MNNVITEILDKHMVNFRRWRLTRWLVVILFERLTLIGRLLVLLAFIIINQTGGKELFGVAHPTYFIASFLVAILIISGLISLLVMPKLNIVRRKLSYSSVGEKLLVQVEIKNISRRTVYDLSIMEWDLPKNISIDNDQAPTIVDHLAAGENSLLQLNLVCHKRGAYTLKDLSAVSTFPLGIWRAMVRTKQESSFLVYPAFTRLETFTVPEGRHYQPGGFLVSSNVGESPEFMGTREYRAGDNLRHIHWPSWARTGKPIVKVYHEEYFVRLALIVDSEVLSIKDDAAFEAGISLAAGIADNLSQRDYIIDIFAAGETIYRFQAGRALAHFDNILQVLACLAPAKRVDWPALCATILADAAKLTAVIAIFTDWTTEREDFIAQMRSLGVGLRVIVIHSGTTILPTPAMAPQINSIDFIKLSPGEEMPW